MSRYKSLLIAIAVFVMAWFFLLYASVDVPENPSDLSDTRGLPAVSIYSVILAVIGGVAIIMSGAGILISMRLGSASFVSNFIVFVVSNALLVLGALLGIFIILSYVLDNPFGVAGMFLYLVVIGFVMYAAPRRASFRPLP
ncbi:hypothetical protein [Pseudomonas halotolerans]|uniref:hypothetical protein n=1 Tax=Pseudomonas halotolerans TaxID=3143552 RepID=UPI0031DD95FA